MQFLVKLYEIGAFVFFLLVVGIIGSVAYATYQGGKEIDQKVSANPCIKDWKKCKDTDAMMNDNEQVSYARIDCDIAASHHGKFGPPVWDDNSGHARFAKYIPEDEVNPYGRIALLDDTGLLPNQYGGKSRIRTICNYDLSKKKVDDIDFEPLSAFQ